MVLHYLVTYLSLIRIHLNVSLVIWHCYQSISGVVAGYPSPRPEVQFTFQLFLCVCTCICHLSVRCAWTASRCFSRFVWVRVAVAYMRAPRNLFQRRSENALFWAVWSYLLAWTEILSNWLSTDRTGWNRKTSGRDHFRRRQPKWSAVYGELSSMWSGADQRTLRCRRTVAAYVLC